MTEENGLSGNMLYSVRYQQMLYNEKDMYKEDFAIMKEKKEKREIERQKDHELEKTAVPVPGYVGDKNIDC